MQTTVKQEEEMGEGVVEVLGDSNSGADLDVTPRALGTALSTNGANGTVSTQALPADAIDVSVDDDDDDVEVGKLIIVHPAYLCVRFIPNGALAFHAHEYLFACCCCCFPKCISP